MDEFSGDTVWLMTRKTFFSEKLLDEFSRNCQRTSYSIWKTTSSLDNSTWDSNIGDVNGTVSLYLNESFELNPFDIGNLISWFFRVRKIRHHIFFVIDTNIILRALILIESMPLKFWWLYSQVFLLYSICRSCDLIIIWYSIP